MMDIATDKDSGLENTWQAPTENTDVQVLPWHWVPGGAADQAWQNVARQMAAWLSQQGVQVADAVVLLPQIALLNVARRAWSEAVGGWAPRFETVGTLLDRLPQGETVSGAGATLTLDPCLDALWVAQRLRGEAAGREWSRRDPDGFEFGVQRMLEVAHRWLQAALATDEAGQEAMVAAIEVWLGEALTPWGNADIPDPRAREKVLTAMALSWAIEALPTLRARRAPIFQHRPSAWLAVTAGAQQQPGSESSLMVRVLERAQAAQVPACWVQAVLEDPSGGVAPRPWLVQATDGEEEARLTAWQVQAQVAQARQRGDARPVALVATDRIVTRRVRALLAPLEKAGQLNFADESGWTLSTTRAASVVTRLLAAAHPRASTDDVLDWLSSAWMTVPGGAGAIGALERRWRKQGALQPWRALPEGEAFAAMQGVLDWAQQVLAPVRQMGRVPLQQALGVLKQCLQASGAWASLLDDEAGKAVVAALRLPLDDALPDESLPTWERLAATHQVGLRELARWVDSTLEAQTFRPRQASPEVDVVITPLTRAVLRPWAAVVLPGADDGMLGVRGNDGWLSPVHALALGLGNAAGQQEAQWEAFAVLATSPHLVALARHQRDGEPVGLSPWLTRWSLAVGATLADVAWQAMPAELPQRDWAWEPPQPLAPSLVSAPDAAVPALMPTELSATGYERLRQCPYRFHALNVLGLQALDEIEEGLGAQDLGTWLHAVLHRFHKDRPADAVPADPADDVARWLAVAAEVAQDMGLVQGEAGAWFLPHQATITRLAQHYVGWLRPHEAQGWCVDATEADREVPLALDEHSTVRLKGRLDRLDRRASTDGTEHLVMDYKTGSLSGLNARVAQPLEDTQLGFYALLASVDHPEADGRLGAMYLRVHDQGCTPVAHPDAQDTAAQMASGIVHDLQRLRDGHPLWALGEGSVCDYCEVRGLCRKDHVAQARPARVEANVNVNMNEGQP
ncbi:MAG: ATP-dependent helicase/nuclease subunit [Pseudomonadota bacterium]